MTERRRLSNENKAIALRLFDEVLNAHNVARCDDLYAPDYVPHSLPPGFSSDREGVNQYHRGRKLRTNVLKVSFNWRRASGGTYASSIARDEALLFQERFVPRDGHEVGFDFRDRHRGSAWLHN